MFLEVEARYTMALNHAITRDGRTTFVVSGLKIFLNFLILVLIPVALCHIGELKCITSRSNKFLVYTRGIRIGLEVSYCTRQVYCFTSTSSVGRV